MKIGQVCSHHVVRVSKHEPIAEAARRMRDEHVGTLVVVEDLADGHVPVGLVTDRDLVVGLLATDVDHLRQIEIGDLVTRELVTARENEDTALVLDRMQRHGIRRIPIVNERGQLTGIFAVDDLLGLLSGDLASVVALIGRAQRGEAARRSS